MYVCMYVWFVHIYKGQDDFGEHFWRYHEVRCDRSWYVECSQTNWNEETYRDPSSGKAFS